MERRRPRTEEEWLDLRERAARRALSASVAGLVDDIGTALHVSPRIRSHHVVQHAVDQAGDILSSDVVLNMIETTISMRASGLRSGASILRAVLALSRRARA